jgi:sigma-E factor negative regulatory protein RseB
VTQRRTLIVLVGATLGAVLASDGIGAREEPDPGAELLRRARGQVATEGFEGEVVVEWRDLDGAHQSAVVVRGAHGSIEVSAGREFVSTVDGGYRREQDHWVAVRSRDAIDVVPEPSSKYDLQVSAGPLVADRATTVVDAVLPESGVLIERVFIDDATGLMLRRERFGADGTVVRRVSFVSIRMGAQSLARVDDQTMAVSAAQDTARLGGIYRDPEHAGDGFEVVSRARDDNGVAHVLYSDGLLTVSVFEEPGSLDWPALSEAGESVEVDGVPGVRYSLAVGAAFVWERDGVVYTALSDGPDDQTLAVAASVSAPRVEGRVARLARTLLAPFEL